MLTVEQKNLRIKLLKALRSGKYKQGHYRLKQGENFCILGVMCDVSQCGQWVVNKKRNSIGTTYNEIYLKHAADLPQQVIDAYALSEELESLLIVQNDFVKLSFEKIASMLEMNEFLTRA